MMHIDIICVGRIREKYFADAVAEYKKRLSAYAKTEIIEVKDEPTPDNASEAQRSAILSAEAERIEKYRNDKAYQVVLAIEGKQTDSVGFSEILNKPAIDGYGAMQFLIGGSLGLKEELKQKADLSISFSKMTFPHQLMRVILLEQIYRGYRILNGAPYHK